MTRNEVQELFQAEHERFKQDWLNQGQKAGMAPVGSSERIFQDWVISRLASMSAAIKRLKLEARKHKGMKK